MINSVQSMQDFAAAVKSTFKWYIRNADSLWQEYSQNTGAGDPFFDPSTYTQEECSAIEDSLEKAAGNDRQITIDNIIEQNQASAGTDDESENSEADNDAKYD